MGKRNTLATSRSLEGIQKLISEYFCGSSITLVSPHQGLQVKSWEVFNKNGKIQGFFVILEKNRYNFVKL